MFTVVGDEWSSVDTDEVFWVLVSADVLDWDDVGMLNVWAVSAGVIV